MRVAAIDLGTNSTRLLIADVDGGQIAEVVRHLTITRLGDGVDATQRLRPDAIGRVRKCLARYRGEIDAHGADPVLAVATSAVRDAQNGPELLAALEREFGLATLLLDGSAEATIMLRGVTSDRALDRETLVVDIGGGSTELLLGGPRGVRFSTSLQLGCVRMTERFLDHDPPHPVELERCAAHVRSLLPSLEIETAIGVAGTVTTAAAIDLGLPGYDPARIHGHRVSRSAVAATLEHLAALPLAEREDVRGLEPARAPVIVGGLVVLREMLDSYRLAEIEASERDILHGAALLAAGHSPGSHPIVATRDAAWHAPGTPRGGPMATTAIDGKLLEALASTFTGTLLTRADGGYDEARQVHNGLIDRHPALIARCAGSDDVAAALGFAREHGLEISVRGGGHNVAGRAVTEGGVMIDLSPLKTIDVDADAGTVRAQGGVNWSELNAATHEHGLAVTGGAISTTGIAGLTLGGGLGWLMAKYGLAADDVIEIELVTAAGERLQVTDDSHPDLMWALRGGGGNFGVAVSFVYRLHPLTTVTGGIIAHPIEAAGDMLRFYRNAVADCPDDLTVFAGLVHAPDGSGAKLGALVAFHAGQPEDAERDLAPFKEWGSPLMTQVGPMPYPVMNTLLDDAYPKGALNYWLSSFVSGLSDGLIDTLLERFTSVPSPMTAILLEHFHGAVTRIGQTDTAVPHRAEGWNLLLPSEWLDAAETETNVTWTKDTFAALSEHFPGRRWLNYLGDDQDAAIRDAYGPNYDRLVQVKRRYDPDNVFHLNHNIVP